MSSSDQFTAVKATSQKILAKYEPEYKDRSLHLTNDIFGWVEQRDLDILIELIHSLLP